MRGPLQGVSLELLPAQVTTWASWIEAHPNSLALVNDMERLSFTRQGFDPDFVIGLVLEDAAKAFYFQDVEQVGVVNTTLGRFPVVVWAQDTDFRAYLRQVGDRILTFSLDGKMLIDQETGSRWDINRGLAVAGELQNESLQAVPSLTSYDWAWVDFYPHSDFYRPD